jgi:hypothetical protein
MDEILGWRRSSYLLLVLLKLLTKTFVFALHLFMRIAMKKSEGGRKILLLINVNWYYI